ncbi:MAG: DSD1 family PLP-dependent enzyme [Xanthobacteraceae bacterium]|nr:DSD1 family PLP-dependent enzyme [Xanthobacteraceae bacterium]
MMCNIARMQQRASALGVSLRPHVKTSKCVEVARRQQAAGASGITVSTLKEAEQFFDAGFADVLYAVGMAPSKLDRALALRRRGCALTIAVDSVAAAQAVIATGHAFDALIEVDCDGHRSGVQPDDSLLIEIGRTLHDGGVILKGVMTHAGSSYDLDTPEALQRLAEQERSRSVRAAQRLRAAGLPCPVVSVGSTPTALSAENLAGVTELRAGVYVFFDLVMANVGVCGLDNLALSVLTTVIGHQPEKGWAIVDAGWMAMSRDRGTQRQKIDYGYGAVCDLAGAPLDGLIMTGANQEHGIVSRRGTADPDIAQRLPVGTQLRILPNHACATGTQFSEYHAVSGARPAQQWRRFDGW